MGDVIQIFPGTKIIIEPHDDVVAREYGLAPELWIRFLLILEWDDGDRGIIKYCHTYDEARQTSRDSGCRVIDRTGVMGGVNV